MNLWYLGKDTDRTYFKRSGDIRITVLDASSLSPSLGNYNAFMLPPGSSITLPGASNWYPYNRFQTHFGWVGWSPVSGAELVLELVNAATSEIVRSIKYQLSSIISPVLAPQLPDNVHTYNLVIRPPQHNSQSLQFGVMQNMKHEALYDSAKGKGIEIGPGIAPRVKPSPQRSVTYLERYDRDEYLKFHESYASQSPDMEALWEHYRVGNAHEIPDDLGQLDFIFSSHVIEHLPNPLGHFQLWRSRLSDTGRVFGLLPQMVGCYDFMYHKPTEFNEWIELFIGGDLTKPKLWQYDKYQARMKRTPDEMAKEDIRPHFSFFTADNLSQFLSFCCDELGYSSFGIRTAANNVSLEFELNV